MSVCGPKREWSLIKNKYFPFERLSAVFIHSDFSSDCLEILELEDWKRESENMLYVRRGDEKRGGLPSIRKREEPSILRRICREQIDMRKE